ncbi:unnamed protein product [Closterium sp. NIES-53]
MFDIRVLLHVAAQRDYELHSLDFITGFLQGSLHNEIWLRHPPGFTETTVATLGFALATADLSLFLRTDTSLPPFYVLVYVDDLVFATSDTEAQTWVKSFSVSASSSPRHSPLLCLPATRSQLHFRTSPMSDMGLVLGGQGPVVLTGHADASWDDDSGTQWSSQGYTFSLGSSSVSWRLKAMIALCQEHRLEHRTKHIALRYFLARELQQRGQLRLAYVATGANTADVFTKALPPGDHQRFATVLGLVPTLPHLLTA